MEHEYTSMKTALELAGVELKSATLFDLMRHTGLVVDISRQSTVDGREKKFPVLTDAGLAFGQNVPGYHAEELEMVFHPKDIPALLQRLAEHLGNLP